ncbi:hypothetical protein KRMM14A1259_11180 [Krasilnikovia sp. MM14-A1259]
MDNGDVRAKVHILGQAASATEDRRWRTPDGNNIGVITAYCVGANVCPNWINDIK